jgi:hypothetical protein
MLDAWIIDEINRRERDQEHGIPLELPLEAPRPDHQDPEEASPTDNRGVFIIETSFSVDV